MKHTLEVKRVGQIIAAERAARRLKMYKVAAVCDIDPSRLRGIERGTIEPSPELVARLLRAIANMSGE